MSDTKTNPFIFVDSVSYSKRDILNDETEKAYLPFIVNRALSYHIDTVLSANLMNIYRDLPKRAQYSFYLNSLRPRKRFAKWVKKEETDGTLEALQTTFNMSETDARIALNLLSKEQLTQLLEKDIGGVIK